MDQKDKIIEAYRNRYDKAVNIDDPFIYDNIADCSHIFCCFPYFDHIVKILEEPNLEMPTHEEIKYPREMEAIRSCLSEKEKEIWMQTGIKDLDIQNRVIKEYIDKYQDYLSNFSYASILLKAPKQMKKVRRFLEGLTKRTDNNNFRIEQLKEKTFDISASFKPILNPLENKYQVTVKRNLIEKSVREYVDKDADLSEEEKEKMASFYLKYAPSEEYIYLDVSRNYILIWIQINSLCQNVPKARSTLRDSCEGRVFNTFVKELFGEQGLFFRKQNRSFDKWEIFDPDSVRFEPSKGRIQHYLEDNLFFLNIEHRESAYNNSYFAHSVDNQPLHLYYDESAFNSLQNFNLSFDSSLGLFADLHPCYEDISPDDVLGSILFDFIHNYYYPMILFSTCQRFVKGTKLSTYLKKDLITANEIKKTLKYYDSFLKTLAENNTDYEISKPSKPGFSAIFLERIKKNNDVNSLFEGIKELRLFVETRYELLVSWLLRLITALTLFSVFADISNFAFDYITNPAPSVYTRALNIGLIVIVPIAIVFAVYLITCGLRWLLRMIIKRYKTLMKGE